MFLVPEKNPESKNYNRGGRRFATIWQFQIISDNAVKFGISKPLGFIDVFYPSICDNNGICIFILSYSVIEDVSCFL